MYMKILLPLIKGTEKKMLFIKIRSDLLEISTRA